MQKLSRFSKCYSMENLKISARMNPYFKLIGESMRKIWLRFSDPWWNNVTSLGVFTWNVPRVSWALLLYLKKKVKLQWNHATSVAFALTDIGMGFECQFFWTSKSPIHEICCYNLQRMLNIVIVNSNSRGNSTRSGRLTRCLTKMRARPRASRHPSTRKKYWP
jgi:hypothetical protein